MLLEAEIAVFQLFGDRQCMSPSGKAGVITMTTLRHTAKEEGDWNLGYIPARSLWDLKSAERSWIWIESERSNLLYQRPKTI